MLGCTTLSHKCNILPISSKTILNPTTINQTTTTMTTEQPQQHSIQQQLGKGQHIPKRSSILHTGLVERFFHLGFWEGGQSSRFGCAKSIIGRKKNCKRVELEIIGVLFTFSENYQDCQELQSIWRSVPENSNLSKISQQGTFTFTFFQ